MIGARYRLKAQGALVWIIITLSSFPSVAQVSLDSLDGPSLRGLRDSLDSFSRGGGLSTRSLESFESVSGLPLSGGSALAAEYLRESGSNRGALESMMQQYGGYLTAEQIQQLESFAAPLGANASQLDAAQLDAAIAGIGEALDGVESAGDATTFEALPGGEEANVESLFLSG